MNRALLFILFISINLSAQIDSVNTAKDKPILLAGGFVGIGYGIISGDASEYFNNMILLPITGDIVYKGFLAQLNLDAGYSTVNKTINFDDGKSWNEGSDAWYDAFGINIGYSVFTNKDYRLTPFVGYASTYTHKKWWGTSDIAEYEPDNNCINAGLMFDFKSIISYDIKDTPEYNGLRITFGAYIPLDDPIYPEYYSGATFYLSVGLVSLHVL